MDKEDIEELAKDLIPLAEENNASQAIMTADYNDKWEFFMGFLLSADIGDLFKWTSLNFRGFRR